MQVYGFDLEACKQKSVFIRVNFSVALCCYTQHFVTFLLSELTFSTTNLLKCACVVLQERVLQMCLWESVMAPGAAVLKAKALVHLRQPHVNNWSISFSTG